MLVKDLPEEKALWKEKLELEETRDETDDTFIPAKLAPESKPDEVYFHFEL
jgi:hypothetical protein